MKKLKRAKTKRKTKQRKTKQRKTKQRKTKQRKTKQRKKIKSGTGNNNPQYRRQKQLEELFNEKNVRNILPKNLRMFSWMTPKLFKKFNSIETIEGSKIYEMSHPGG